MYFRSQCEYLPYNMDEGPGMMSNDSMDKKNSTDGKIEDDKRSEDEDGGNKDGDEADMPGSDKDGDGKVVPRFSRTVEVNCAPDKKITFWDKTGIPFYICSDGKYKRK